MEAPFDYNQRLASHQTPFGERVQLGAGLDEVRLALAGGANPFVGMPSALATVLVRPSPSQRDLVQAFLQEARADHTLTESDADRVYAWLLTWDVVEDEALEKQQQTLLSAVIDRSSLTTADHRPLALMAAHKMLSVDDLSMPSLKALLEPLGALSGEEVLEVIPRLQGVVSWPALKLVLDKVPPDERLWLWEEGIQLPEEGSILKGWLVQFIAKGRPSSVLGMLRYTCGGQWCPEVHSPDTEERRAHLATHLLCDTNANRSFDPISKFPGIVESLFPRKNVAEAVARHVGTLWFDVLNGYVGSYANDHKRNRTDARLDLGTWLLAQPQPSISKADKNGTTAFDAWESMADRIDSSSVPSPESRVARVIQLGKQLLALGAANEWVNDHEHRRARPFKHPGLRALQEQAAAQEREHRLNVALPHAAVRRSSPGPRF
jgi:hypothetical protein